MGNTRYLPPRHMSEKKQVECFRKYFHDVLIAEGFVCPATEMPKGSKASALELLKLSGYHRIVNNTIWQTVSFFIGTVCPARMRYARQEDMVAHISVNEHLLDQFMGANYYLATQLSFDQYRFSGAERPGGQTSHMNLLLQDNPAGYTAEEYEHAMQKELEVFITHTLPKLNAPPPLTEYARRAVDEYNKTCQWHLYGYTMRPYRYVWKTLIVKDWINAERMVRTLLIQNTERKVHRPYTCYDSAHELSRWTARYQNEYPEASAETIRKMAEDTVRYMQEQHEMALKSDVRCTFNEPFYKRMHKLWEDMLNAIQTFDAAAVDELMYPFRAENIEKIRQNIPALLEQLT